MIIKIGYHDIIFNVGKLVRGLFCDISFVKCFQGLDRTFLLSSIVTSVLRKENERHNSERYKET